MGLSRYRVGELVLQYKEECGVSNLRADLVSGINADKEFFEPAKQVGQDTSKYRIVPSGYYACNLMHVGRDVVLPIALNRTARNKIVSPAYSVFQLVADEIAHPEYLYMLFNSTERDRYFWFHTDGSVRDGMSWDDFCACEIELPPIGVQRKCVAIYEAMLANQRAYEKGLDDLKLTCDALLDRCKKSKTWEPVGKHLREVDARNASGKCDVAYGVNIKKEFMLSRASSDDLLKYKLVKPGQIACNLLHVGRDASYPIAVNETDSCIAVSPAYSVFMASNTDMAVFLMAWFSRTEIGRNGWFICDDSIRGSMAIDRFLSCEIPIPDGKTIKAIAELRTAYWERARINACLKAQLKDLCPILIRGSVEEASR